MTDHLSLSVLCRIVRFWLWWTADRVLICPECGKTWPRGKLWTEQCTGSHLHPHERRWMRGARVIGHIEPVERAAAILAFDWDWK